MLAGLIACATATPAAARSAEAAPIEQAPGHTPGHPPGQATEQAGGQAGEVEQIWVSESGTASWYGQRHHGRRTASGSLFNQNAMTAAHPWLPMGTKVKVTRLDTGQSIIVTITDRLPSKKRVIDLSYGAAQKLGMVNAGTADVDLEPV